ncbi:hypothetical protein SASPL_151820 [Salvia splendens]|uniref:Uncharacterized protein n=1 Tax=Salvia splendens TaxID=180675 RepID=A0A8X8YZF4_SALSN|nr:hypothetical protein SASPL_151820 [Salvia splendens]
MADINVKTPGTVNVDIPNAVEETPGAVKVDIPNAVEETPGAVNVDISNAVEETSGAVNVDISNAVEETSGAVNVDISNAVEETSGAVNVDISNAVEETSGAVNVDISNAVEETSGAVNVDISNAVEETSGAVNVDISNAVEETSGAVNVDISNAVEETSGAVNVDISNAVEETSGAVNVDIHEIVEENPGAVSVDVQSGWRVLHRVPKYMRKETKRMKEIYDPVVVSLGPYHCNTPELKLLVPLKNEVLDLFCGGASRKSFLQSKVSERIDEIRHFYGGVKGKGKDTDKDKDGEKLDEMMLRDACFLVCYMRGFCDKEKNIYGVISQRLGMSGLLFMHRDMFILENQIPFWLISLINNQCDEESGEFLLREFLSFNVFGERRKAKLPWEREGEQEPLHLLEAFHRTYLQHDKNHRSKKSQQPNGREGSLRTEWQRRNSPFRSVKKLQSKGIDFRQSSNCLTDIKFTKAQLQLPSFCFTSDSKVFFSNLIAFEMSPDTVTDYGVTSYFNFMKTLIHKPKDVKVLREKGILYSLLAKDEEVVEMFKSIDTYGYSNDDLLCDVKKSIEEHCNNKTRTWMAEFINTYFQTPWTAIALAAAIFLLCLTFLQTFFTIYPRK